MADQDQGRAQADPIARVVGRVDGAVHLGFSHIFTRHDVYARCPECTHSTVGYARPWVINHAASCGVPTEGYGNA